MLPPLPAAVVPAMPPSSGIDPASGSPASALVPPVPAPEPAIIVEPAAPPAPEPPLVPPAPDTDIPPVPAASMPRPEQSHSSQTFSGKHMRTPTPRVHSHDSDLPGLPHGWMPVHACNQQPAIAASNTRARCDFNPS